MATQKTRKTESKQVKQTIQPDPVGDTKSRIEDKVRALPENQGVNEDEMWNRIDEEVEAARKAGTLLDNEERNDQHGNAQIIWRGVYTEYMPRFNIFIPDYLVEQWEALENKSQWVQEQLELEYEEQQKVASDG